MKRAIYPMANVQVNVHSIETQLTDMEGETATVGLCGVHDIDIVCTCGIFYLLNDN